MYRAFGVLLLVSVVSCRDYNYHTRLTADGGLMPVETYARYGREQAVAMAIARELGRDPDGAEGYARSLPEVADVTRDPRGDWLTVRFRNGWRVAVTPVTDGKSGSETPGAGQ
jgi:hypothetical protein